MQIDIGGVGPDCPRRAPTHMKRYRPLTRERQRATNVIAVFVRDLNGVELLDTQLEPEKASLDFLRGETAVEHHASRRGSVRSLDDKSIALAAAAEAGKTHSA